MLPPPATPFYRHCVLIKSCSYAASPSSQTRNADFKHAWSDFYLFFSVTCQSKNNNYADLNHSFHKTVDSWYPSEEGICVKLDENVNT